MSEAIVSEERELRDVLARVSFAPSCVDMAWQWKIYDVNGRYRRIEGWLVATTFQRPDTSTGKVARGEGRQWFIRRGESVSGVVKTAWAACKMILEHELHEAFRFDGKRVFDPHVSVEALTSIARKEQPT